MSVASSEGHPVSAQRWTQGNRGQPAPRVQRARRSSLLAQGYRAAVREYLSNREESALHRAYELGRQAAGLGLGIMDLVKAHEEVLTALLGRERFSPEAVSASRSAVMIFAESLWPFEMIQRGFGEVNRDLRKANEALARRARQLEAANGSLHREIVRRKRVESALREREEELRRVARQVLNAQEEERKRLSRELHDEVGQALTAIQVSLATWKEFQDPRLQKRFRDLQHLLRHTMETVHAFTRELRPAMLDDLGLVPALRAYVRSFAKRTGLRIRFAAVPEAELLGMDEKTVLYRVTQEGLNNVVKHAGADRASVLVSRAEGGVSIEVRDNGKSFQPRALKGRRHRQGLGLVGIQERVRLVHGQFALSSEPGRGTVIRVRVPLKIGGAKAN